MCAVGVICAVGVMCVVGVMCACGEVELYLVVPDGVSRY